MPCKILISAEPCAMGAPPAVDLVPGLPLSRSDAMTAADWVPPPGEPVALRPRQWVRGAVRVAACQCVPVPPFGLVTTISTVPVAGCAGAVTVIWVLLTTVTLVPAIPSNVTVAPARKLTPVRVTTVPPAVGPERAETERRRGAIVARRSGRRLSR